MKPIRSKDLGHVVPDIVISRFNDAIEANFNGKESTVYQNDVMSFLVKDLNMTSSEIFDRKYLDIEKIYESAGWEVRYNKPAWGETHEIYFEFIKIEE